MSSAYISYTVYCFVGDHFVYARNHDIMRSHVKSKTQVVREWKKKKEPKPVCIYSYKHLLQYRHTIKESSLVEEVTYSHIWQKDYKGNKTNSEFEQIHNKGRLDHTP